MKHRCNICPRNCNTDRETKRGYCNSPNSVFISRAALHMWEEPCISGSEGSGAIFFDGCNLRCIFCQNHVISHGPHGREVDIGELTNIMLKLQDKGANNINLVTPTHYTDSLIEALVKARNRGLSIPTVYNTSGYESVDTLKKLEGLIDIYLPDHKYFSSKLSFLFSNAKDYHEVAGRALREMLCQVGEAEFDERGIMRKGIIVRHMVLPGHTKDSMAVIRYLFENFGNDIFISIMSQYTPIERNLKEVGERFPELKRTVTKREYEKVVDYAIGLGIENAYIQGEGIQKENFIPEFDQTNSI